MSLDLINNQFHRSLREKINSRSTFDTWFKDTAIISYEDGKAVISVSNSFARRLLARSYAPVVDGILQDIFHQPMSVQYVEKAVEESSPRKGKTPPLSHTNLNPKYTFSDFVVGENNRFAHAASMAVAENPSKIYNPLYLYGGVGLGKTHLMHAIGHHYLEKNPSSKVLYVSSQTFTNDLINNLKEGKIEFFRSKYRNVDLLLIDDIQFLENKEKTQDEFFHTFNFLRELNKQIVISSDSAPSRLDLEERLISRFNWGLTTDISKPDFETRVAILRKKADLDGITLSDQALSVIASLITTNIRELEGSLTKVDAHVTLDHMDPKDVTEDFIRKVLKDIAKNPSNLGLNDVTIKKAVANFYGITLEDLNSRRRSRNIAFPRQIAMYLIREMTEFSLPKIGKSFGGKDHTTVMHACGKIEVEIQTKPEVKQVVNQIRENLEAGKY